MSTPTTPAALVSAEADDTVLTEAFSLGWPDAPHRVLRLCVDASELGPDVRSPLPPTRAFSGDVATSALYAGTSVADVTMVVPAARVIRELVRDAEAALRRGPAER